MPGAACAPTAARNAEAPSPIGTISVATLGSRHGPFWMKKRFIPNETVATVTGSARPAVLSAPPSGAQLWSGVPVPPVHGAPYSGLYFWDTRNLLTNSCSRGSVGEVSRSWYPHEETTIGAGSPG